jgi:hypothetical protein
MNNGAEHSAADNTSLRSVLRLHNPFSASKKRKNQPKLEFAKMQLNCSQKINTFA